MGIYQEGNNTRLTGQDLTDHLENQNKTKVYKERTHSEKCEFFESIDSELWDNLDKSEIDNINSYEDLMESLEECHYFDVDIIYYYKAMEYLSREDSSLSESIEIATDLGYELKNINSETLASLHASNKQREEFYNLQEEVNKFFIS